MKNVMLLLASAILTIIYGDAYAQKIETISSASISQFSQNNAGHQIMRNQVPSRAYRHFMKTYTAIKDELWHLNETGLVAMFYTDGMPQISFYDRKGNWVPSVFNYNQAKLPKRTFEVVKSAYCDYAITHCSEVKTSTASAFYISILKGNDYKILKVQEQEIHLQNQYIYNKGE